ncbi:MAG: universal stress protein [Pyrinomonadaceae bacterium]
MKVLIGFNGSKASSDALVDLKFAGLPDDTEIQVVTVAESWVSPGSLDEARVISEEAAKLVSTIVNNSNVSAFATEGSPPREILSVAEKFGPDLILLGEPPQDSGHNNMFLGQTSQIVLTESSCSVRIARKSTANAESARMIVGFNGSPAAMLAVDAIIARSWPSNAEVKLLAVADSSVLASIGRFAPQMTDSLVEEKLAHQWAETLAGATLEKLRNANIQATLQVAFGHPKDVIAKEAGRWNATSIFVGPHCSLNSYERFLIGSVSASLAAQAPCSVEIVRRSPNHIQ